MAIKKKMEQDKDLYMKNNKQVLEASPHIFKSFIVLFGVGVAYSIFDMFVLGNYGPRYWIIEFWLRIFVIPIVAFVETAALHGANLFWSLIFKRFSETWALLSLIILVLLNMVVTSMMDYLGGVTLFLFPAVGPFIASFLAGLIHEPFKS